MRCSAAGCRGGPGFPSAASLALRCLPPLCFASLCCVRRGHRAGFALRVPPPPRALPASPPPRCRRPGGGLAGAGPTAWGGVGGIPDADPFPWQVPASGQPRQDASRGAGKARPLLAAPGRGPAWAPGRACTPPSPQTPGATQEAQLCVDAHACTAPQKRRWAPVPPRQVVRVCVRHPRANRGRSPWRSDEAPEGTRCKDGKGVGLRTRSVAERAMAVTPVLRASPGWSLISRGGIQGARVLFIRLAKVCGGTERPRSSG